VAENPFELTFQSTPPHGRRPIGSDVRTLIYVSIHASAREATVGVRTCLSAALVSIHASAREATGVDSVSAC